MQSSKEEDNVLGSKLEGQTYWNSVVPYAANFIYSPKDVHKNFDAANTQALGDWLSGVVGNWGPYFDAYTYYGCGIQGQPTNGGGDRCSRSYPEEAIGQTMLDQYLQGATVYTLENQLDNPAVGDLYTPTFWQSVLPAFRYIIAHPAPSKSQVAANIKVAFSESAGNVYGLPDTTSGRVTFFEGLSENVPDIANTQGLFYYPRSSGRYYAVPRLPKLASSSVVSEFPSVITSTGYQASLQGLTAKQAYFNARYPTFASGDAFVEHIGSQYLVYNNHYSSSTQGERDDPADRHAVHPGQPSGPAARHVCDGRHVIDRPARAARRLPHRSHPGSAQARRVAGDGVRGVLRQIRVRAITQGQRVADQHHPAPHADPAVTDNLGVRRALHLHASPSTPRRTCTP